MLILTFLKKHIRTIVEVLLVVIIFVFIYFHFNKANSVVVIPSDKLTANNISKAIDVSQDTAKEIIMRIEQVAQKPPVITYTVVAQNPNEAAKRVEQQINTNTAPVKLPVADKTIITPQPTKVDVYRINLEKKNSLNIGVIPNRLYFVGITRQMATIKGNPVSLGILDAEIKTDQWHNYLGVEGEIRW
jgi:hypothetical protein